ncbi:MAG TPA: heme o synthase [Candidatus Thermoplasmatota archaeon]|nr:heme o synthase [Candidatus Thermoplasmatota archaeon]
MAVRRATFERLVIAALVSTFVLICVGAYVVKIGAGQACPTWPKCFEDAGSGLANWAPFLDADANLHGIPPHMVAAEWIHRLLASVVTFLVVAVTWIGWRLRPVDRAIRALATLASAFLFTQILLGGVTVLLGNAPWTVVLHQGNAMLVFGTLTALTTLVYARRPAPASTSASASGSGSSAEEEPAGAAPGPMTSRPWTGTLQQKLGPWFELVKPGILLLLVLCGAAAMFLAGRPPLRLVAATLFGGALAASSAAAFNNYLDRDRDALLARTKKRSIPSSRIPAKAALFFAFVSGIAAFAYLTWRVNLLTAALAIAGIAFYVYYTIWLKPSTVQNIVIGGAAGAAPALVGWAAVTGQLSIPALILGFIIFAWTPPHFWALALVYKDDYAKGAVPMYPVVKGAEATRKQIFVYTILTVAATLAFIPFKILGAIYLVSALVLGAWFVALAARLLVKKDNKAAYAVFGYSIAYLGLLFVAMVVDRIVLR